jgi:hypothetical protein
MGLKEEKGSFPQALFYFMREFHFNPLDEEFTDGKKYKWIKKGISIPLFNALMEEANKHYKREEAELNKMKRR